MPPGPQASASVALHPASGAHPVVTGDVLQAIVEGIGMVTGTDRHCPPGALERTCVLSTSGYDVWEFVWGAGATAPTHDHAGSASAHHVVAGTLAECSWDLDGSPHVRAIRTGASSALSASARHVLRNATSEVVVSVHAFSPPVGP